MTARRIGNDYAIKEYNRPPVYVMLIAVGLIYPLGITTATRALVFEAFRVAAGSMHPGLLEGDRVLVNKLGGRGALPQRGDVVAFRNLGEGAPIFLKRVMALPGDTIEVRERSVMVNGCQIDNENRKTGTANNTNAAKMGFRCVPESHPVLHAPLVHPEISEC